jgi:LuxR family maltose regulon positive regulatory protein
MSSTSPSITEESDQINSSTQEKRETLLSTKLFTPSIRPDHLSRSRLIAQINAGLEKPLILISAPAGYGKTTLVCSWIYKTNTPNSWISLDEGDNDLIHFLQYLLTALQQVIPAIQVEMLSTLRGPASFVSLLNAMINEISKHIAPFVLVLDDFHVLHAQPVLDFLASLIEHAPSNMHVILISRTDPLLPLSHLRVRNEIAEIRADQLRFTRDEIDTFLSKIMTLELSIADITALQTRTEGWIAGVQLAALSMQSCEDIHAFVTAFAGSHHYIIDYLTEEVLKRLPEKTSTFLLRTSILSRMCGPLCDTIVEPNPNDQVNGQEILEQLERKNLFLVSLDDKRHWYRYHHLFSDVLIRYLENSHPHLPAQLHKRASQWFEQNGYIPESIDHALMAGDLDQTTKLIEQNGVLLLIRGEVMAVLKWITGVEPYMQTHPWLYILKAWAYALSGDLDRVDGMLKKAEELISSLEPSQEVKVMQGTIAAARAYQANLMGDAHKAVDFARQAIEVLPDVDLVSRSLRAVSTSLLGDATSMTGDLEEAKQAYIESARISQAAGDVHLTIVVNSNLADIFVEQGILRQAARIYSETLSMATRPDGQKAVIAGRLLVELSQVYYEWNQLENAFEYAQQSLNLCRQWGNMDLQAVGFAQLARLERIYSHSEEMQAASQAAEQLLNGYDLAPRYSLWVRSVLARLLINQGNLERALHLVQKSGIDLDSSAGESEIPYLLEPMYLILLRLVLAQRKYNQALGLSHRLLHQAEAGNRAGRVIEILILQALAYHGKNDKEQALAILERAIMLAQPEGFVRVFLDEGEPMEKLLYQAKVHQVGASYLSELLSHVSTDSNQALPNTQLLVEPLTKRELELLKLIEQGCTNQEIADRLVISIPTVKRHISNIYSKLGVKNRTQAISIGKKLNLFG